MTLNFYLSNFDFMTIKSPRNKLMVQIERKYQDEKVTKEGWRYYQDASYNPEWHVTCVGKVVSTPNSLVETNIGSFYTKIPQDIVAGDELAFGYWVIKDFEVKNDNECFSEVSEADSTNFKLFENGKNERVKFQMFNRSIAAAVWTRKNGELIDGCQGTPAEVQKWMKQFPYVSDTDVTYKNLIFHDDQDYWMVDYMEAIAVRREGEIIMLAGNVLLEKQEERMVYEKGAGHELHLMTKVDYGKSKVISIGKPLIGDPNIHVKAGDTVRFDQRIVQKYELWGENYLIVQQNQILGTENAD